MLPYILAAIGGYLIGDSLKGKQYAEGGMMPESDFWLMDEKREQKSNYLNDGVENYSVELQYKNGEIKTLSNLSRAEAVKKFDESLNNQEIYHQILHINYNSGNIGILKEAKNGKPTQKMAAYAEGGMMMARGGDSLKGQQYAEGGMMANGGNLDISKLKRFDVTYIPKYDETQMMQVKRKMVIALDEDGVKKQLGNKAKVIKIQEKYAEGGMMARGGLTGRDKKLLDAGFRLTIITDMYNHKIIIEKNKKTNKIEYIVIEGDIFSKHKKLKEFDTESEAFSYLSTKAGRKVKQAVD